MLRASGAVRAGEHNPVIGFELKRGGKGGILTLTAARSVGSAFDALVQEFPHGVKLRLAPTRLAPLGQVASPPRPVAILTPTAGSSRATGRNRGTGVPSVEEARALQSATAHRN